MCVAYVYVKLAGPCFTLIHIYASYVQKYSCFCTFLRATFPCKYLFAILSFFVRFLGSKDSFKEYLKKGEIYRNASIDEF